MEYYIIDTETTGLDANFHELTEVSIIRCKDLVQKVWLLKPRYIKRISKQSLEVTGKTIEELLSRKYYIDDVAEEIDQFIKEDGEYPDARVMIAHAASFDRRFMEVNWKRMNRIWLSNYWLDTKEMGRKYVKEILKIDTKKVKVSLKLTDLLKTAGVKNAEQDNQHSAEVDSRNTYRLWKLFNAKGLSNTRFTTLSVTLRADLDYSNDNNEEAELNKLRNIKAFTAPTEEEQDQYLSWDDVDKDENQEDVINEEETSDDIF